MVTISEKLELQRAKSAEFFAEHQERLASVEDRVVSQLDAIGSQLGDWQEYQSAAVEIRQSDLERARQLEEQQAELVRLKQELQEREAATGEATSKEVQRLKEMLKDKEQRHQRLASELKSTRVSLEERRDEEQKLRNKLSRARQLLNERAAQLSDAREELKKLSVAQCDTTSHQELEDALVGLQEERDQLRDELAELRVALQQQEEDDTQSNEEMIRLRRQFEDAVENLRHLKTENEELQDQLTELEQNQAEASANQDVLAGWELQKQKLMAELGGNEGGVPMAAQPRPLASPAEGADAPLAGDEEAARLNAIFDNDEIVARERERLTQLQEECREKMCQTEVALAVERATHARERIEIQEKLHNADQELKQAERSRRDVEGANHSETTRSFPPKRKWLQRLGLDGDD